MDCPNCGRAMEQIEGGESVWHECSVCGVDPVRSDALEEYNDMDDEEEEDGDDYEGW